MMLGNKLGHIETAFADSIILDQLIVKKDLNTEATMVI